ncbi:MAG: histidinol-phosphate transaminase [Actinomycetaceae bacterium]|nr:histidinol-phosphate transaminase [Actinomycetaceae bacterium]MDY5854697.1 histidinol-phosphate transaminase [Arcanobacterium sp.]
MMHTTGSTANTGAGAEQFFHPYIMSLPAYVAGKASPNPDVIKVASNEIPFPTLPAVTQALEEHLRDLNRYPDMGNVDLTDAIAAYHGVSARQVCVGNGSVALIEKIIAGVAGEGADVVMPWRSFEAYPIAIQMSGARPVAVPLRADGNCDLDGMLAAVTDKTRAVMVCTPNNPSGSALTHRELRDFVAQVPSNILVIVDEAYVDFVRMDDPVRALELIDEYPNVISLRTFSKAYGLAGLRCGYAIAEPSVIAALTAANTPFGVNTLAQVAALAALRERSTVDERVRAVVDEREALQLALRELGWQGPASQANFIWFDLGKRSENFADMCLRHGLVVRAFAGDGVRVTVAEPHAQQRLIAAYEEWVHSE